MLNGVEPSAALGRDTTMLREILTMIEDGKLAPAAGKTFAFDQARAALDFALGGKGMGKTVLEIA